MQIRSFQSVQRLQDEAARQRAISDQERSAVGRYAEQAEQLTAALAEVQGKHAAAQFAADEAADQAHDFTEMARVACEANGWSLPQAPAPAPAPAEQPGPLDPAREDATQILQPVGAAQ